MPVRSATLVVALFAAGCTFDPGVLLPQDLAAPMDLVVADLTQDDGGGVDAAPDLIGGDLFVQPVLTVDNTDFNGTVDLTGEGTIDYMHFGLVAATDVDRKQGANALTASSKGSLMWFGSYTPTFFWSDGTPTVTANTHSGTYVSGVMNGFTLTAPSTTTARTLKVYVSQYQSTSTFTAHLSDGSVADVIKPRTVGGTNATQIYTVTYQTAGAATLTVTFINAGATGDVDLLAATLH